MTQGESLSPTIFNLLVDAVVRHWEYLVAEQAGGGGISNDTNDMAQLAGRMIRARDNSQQQAEEGRDPVPRPYPSMISRQLDLSKALYALCRSRKIAWSTAFLMNTTY